MKKTLKNVLICIVILYFILSSIYTIFEKGMCTEELRILQSGDSNYEFIETDKLNYKDILENTVYTKINAMDTNIYFIILSSIIGGILGLTISTKENSKIKYILFFIFGGIIYTSIWAIISCIAYYASGITDISYYTYKFTTILLQVFKQTFLSYILIYGAIYIAHILNNKAKVEKLNENLKREEASLNEQKTEILQEGKKGDVSKEKSKINRKKVRNVFIIIMLIVVSIFTITIMRKASILINYSKAISNLNNYNNYYIIEEINYTDEKRNVSTDSVIEIYSKDGVYLTKENGEIIRYENVQNKEAVYLSQKDKKAYIKQGEISQIKMQNIFYADSNIRTWANILLSFEVKISNGKCNDIECYILERDNVKIYIRKDNYLPAKEIIETHYVVKDGKGVSISTDIYTYKLDRVTQNDVAKPDLTEYKIETISETKAMLAP